MRHTVHVRGQEAARALMTLVAAARGRLRSSDMDFHWAECGRGQEECIGATLTFEIEEKPREIPMARTYEDGIRESLAVAEEWASNTKDGVAWAAKKIAEEIRSKLTDSHWRNDSTPLTAFKNADGLYLCGKAVFPTCVLGRGHAGPCTPQCEESHGPGGARCIRQKGHGP